MERAAWRRWVQTFGAKNFVHSPHLRQAAFGHFSFFLYFHLIFLLKNGVFEKVINNSLFSSLSLCYRAFALIFFLFPPPLCSQSFQRIFWSGLGCVYGVIFGCVFCDGFCDFF